MKIAAGRLREDHTARKKVNVMSTALLTRADDIFSFRNRHSFCVQFGSSYIFSSCLLLPLYLVTPLGALIREHDIIVRRSLLTSLYRRGLIDRYR